MASSDEQLQIVISAIDNASATLKQVAGNVTESSGQIQQSSDKASSSFGTLVSSIFSAQIAFQALGEVESLVKGFFEDSISAAMDESATMAQVKVDVDNAGLSYEKYGPLIDAAAKANERLGFTNDETELSLGKLILATGSYSDAVKLNGLAMDLSRAKGIDLNSATVLLQQVMAGNTRVLKQYGISLDSSTTSAEALNILQGKLQGSAKAYGETSAGKLSEVKAQWEAVQEQVGNGLMPIMNDLFAAFESNLPGIINFITGLASDVVDVWNDFKQLNDVIPIFSLIAEAIKPVLGYLQNLKDALDAVAAETRDLKGTTMEYANNQTVLGSAVQGNIDKFNQLHPNLKITADEFKNYDLNLQKTIMDQVSAAEKTGKLTASTNAAATNFNDLPNHINAANNAVLKHSAAIAKLQADYDKMKDAGASDLATLADEFKTKMQSINDSIAKTQQSIADLTGSYNLNRTDETASVADSIVASEQKIADIKKQLANASSQSEIQSLNEQLMSEQKNYDSSLAFRTANAAAITAAESKAKETDLQRTIDDYTAKQKLELDDYNKKLATLNQELLDKKNEAAAETLLYTNKTAQINKILDSGNAYFKKLSDDRKSTTTNEVNAEIASFQALAAAIGQTKSASISALPTINIPQHESGGFVNAPRGTAVPIIAHGGEEVIPAEQTGSRGRGGSISIVINNPSVRNDGDITSMRRQLEDILRPVLLNAKIAHI